MKQFRASIISSVIFLTLSCAFNQIAQAGNNDGIQEINEKKSDPENNKEHQEEHRRCAYLGRCGSFTLIGNNGTAAYILGNEEFIADLEAAGEDQHWWIYRTINGGDDKTKKWAFARRPECGRYRVLRLVNGNWCEHEQVHAWGNLNGARASSTQVKQTQAQQNIGQLLKDIYDKLEDIQPMGAPSLKDISNQIKDSK